jgi:hypothetical protein
MTRIRFELFTRCGLAVDAVAARVGMFSLKRAREPVDIPCPPSGKQIPRPPRRPLPHRTRNEDIHTTSYQHVRNE